MNAARKALTNAVNRAIAEGAPIYTEQRAEPETFTLDCEYTDTFGGEANYCWVERATLTLPCSTSDREMVRRVKAEFGLTGVRGRTYVSGDMVEFRPAKCCTVVFANVRY